jgi:hypothetical protein
MTDRERVLKMADECRKAGHSDVSICSPCVPCMVRLVAEERAEAVRVIGVARGQA